MTGAQAARKLTAPRPAAYAWACLIALLVLALAGAAGLAAGVLRVPAASGARPEALARVAARLEARTPGTPLLGGYWSTYVFAAFQHPGTMLPPVPCEGRLVRTPWWAGDLRRHR